MELLAPGGDTDAIKAAIVAGADAIYCGLDKFNARNRATNISFNNLQGILRLAHQHDCKVFLTLNILIVESELPALISLLNRLLSTSIDGLIIQDLGLFHLLSTWFKSFKLHASTQLTTHNEGQIQFLGRLTATRVNLSRELCIDEIEALTQVASRHRMDTEVFVHGSYCLSFSGLCYLSSVHGGNSGNRGRCSQPCRDRYLSTPTGKNYPLNLKDNSAFFDVKELAEAGVSSLKIEGRIKKADYVHTVVQSWRKQLDGFYQHGSVNRDNSDLFRVFNRDFSDGYLKGQLTNDLFIDNPRDHSAAHLSEINEYATPLEQEQDKMALYNRKEEMKAAVQAKIDAINIAPIPLTLTFSGTCCNPLKVTIETDNTLLELSSLKPLTPTGTQPLNEEVIVKRFKVLNEAGYILNDLILDLPTEEVYLPFKELTALRDRVVTHLTDSGEKKKPVVIPSLKKAAPCSRPPALLILIDNPHEVKSLTSTQHELCFQMPSAFKDRVAELTDLFMSNPTLIPWFPPVLIGDEYQTGVTWLGQVRPQRVITNNTGIAYECWRRGIPWIAGPFLNLTNSYSLLALKERFNCTGAFLSNELSKRQMLAIQPPNDFDLYYSLYHPIALMTSRQCLSRQVEGCDKETMDENCLPGCVRSSTLTNQKEETFYIAKSRGHYHQLYNDANFLNTEIVRELPDRFSGFLADLRTVKTSTRVEVDKPTLVNIFENLLKEDPEAAQALHQMIQPTTYHPYLKGI